MADDGSILNDVKKVLGIDPEYEVYDVDIVVSINAGFATLHQLGVGPNEMFMITDDKSKWSDFTTTTDLSSVKSYLWTSVRLQFDPPTTSFAITALQNLKSELEWRMHIAAEGRPTV